MKKIIFLFLSIITINHSLNAQSDFEIRNGLLLRGKVLGGFIIEDIWILNATLGMEYRITKNFSLGLDFVHINEIFETEYYPDPQNDPDHYIEFAQKNPRTCVLADLRFYPFQKQLSYSTVQPYISLFAKYGSIITWNVPNYPFHENDVVRRDGVFYDLGITGGVHIVFDSERFGLDVNIGYCQRKQLEDVQYYAPTGNTLVYDQLVIKNRLAGRINLFFYLFSNNE